MTPILLNNTFYLIDNMEFDEILRIANTEGLSSPKLRASAAMQLSENLYDSSLVRRFLPQIERGLFQVGDKYLVKTIKDVTDLDYFIAPDNKKYTCDVAYYSQDKKSSVVAEDTSKNNVINIDKNIKRLGTLAITEEELNEKLDEADFLDSFLAKQHRVSSFILDSQIEDLKRYLSVSKDDLDREVKRPFLADARITDIIDGDLGTKSIENMVGRSNNMLDSLLTYPVFSAIIGKKNLSEKFSMLALEGSEFVRICPVGMDEKGNLYGFVHMIKLTSPVVSKIENEIKSELKKEGRKFASLSSSEKYQMFEVRLAEYYAKNSGKMLMASGSRKYVNIVEFIHNMSKKYVVPDVYSAQDSMILWPSHEIVTFDNRGTKTLREQVTDVYSRQEENIQPVQKFIQQKEDVPLLADASRSRIITFRPTIEDERPIVAQPNLMLFDSILKLSGKNKSDVLTLHDQTGEVVSEVPIRKTSGKPTRIIGRGVLGTDIVQGSVTIGGIDPMKPTKFIDENGREWVSEEHRDMVMRAIFGEEKVVGSDIVTPKRK